MELFSLYYMDSSKSFHKEAKFIDSYHYQALKKHLRADLLKKNAVDEEEVAYFLHFLEAKSRF